MNQSLGLTHGSECNTSSSLFLATRIVLWIMALLAALLNILFCYILYKCRSFDANVRICLRTMTIGSILSMLTKIVSVPYDIFATDSDIPATVLLTCSLIQLANFIGHQINLTSFVVLAVERIICTVKQAYNETDKPNAIVIRALATGFFLSFLLPVANMLRMLSDPVTMNSTCFCFISQLDLPSAIIYAASITVGESLLLPLFLIAHYLIKRNKLELEKHSFQQTATVRISVKTIQATSQILLFCALLYTVAAWVILLTLVVSTWSQVESYDSKPLLINIVLIVSAVSQCGTPIIAVSGHKQLRTTAQQSAANLFKRSAHRESKRAIESEDNKGRGALGVAVDSESVRSSSAQRKSLVPAAPTTGPQQHRNTALMFKDDHSARTGQKKVDKLPALSVAPRSSVQGDRESQINLFWQQTAKWGSSGLDFGWGPSTSGKIHQRRESVLVLPKIEPKPVARRNQQMPSID